MSGIERIVKSYSVIAMLVFSVLSSLSYFNDSLWFPAANADTITIDFNGLESLDRRIFYLVAERDDPLRINVRAPDLPGPPVRLTHQGTDHLPPGITVTPRTATASQFTIHVDDIIDVEESQMPITYGVNFDYLGTTDSTASILFVIEAKDSAARPLPTIKFDKEMYSTGDQATLTVHDPHVDCVVPDSDDNGNLMSGTSVQVNLTSEPLIAALASSITLLRDPYSNNEFRGSLTLPSIGTGMLQARYAPGASSCVFPAEPSVQVEPAEARVSAERISFDRTNYVLEEDATITVLDNDDVVDPISFSAVLTVDSTETPLVVPAEFDSFTSLVRLAAANSFTASVPLRQLITDPNFQQGYVTVTATYSDGPSGDQDVMTVLPERRLSFVIPEGSSSYFTNDTASLELLRPESNADANLFSPAEVTLCSFTSGVDGNVWRTVVPLAETGRNTGIFVNSYHLAFIDSSFVIDLLPDEPDVPGIIEPTNTMELFSQSNIGVKMDGESQLLASFGNNPCPDGIPSSLGPMDDLVTVLPGEASNPETGKGYTNPPSNHFDPPLITVSQVNCNQFNYGPDTDQDGICDNWETTSGVKVYYPAGGGSWTLTYTNDPAPKPDHKDIFVEIDHVDNTGKTGCNDGRGNTSWKLTSAPVNNVEAAFRGGHVLNDDGVTGVELHIYLDDPLVDPDSTIPCIASLNIWKDTGGGGDTTIDSYDEAKRDNFGATTSERPSTNKGKAKWQVFHYGISMPEQTQDPASSGVAEQLGNDFVISIGAPGFTWSTNHMQGTLMHELGHNLGLYHGGPDVLGNDYYTNCKPNYPSVMTYIRQTNTPYSNNSLTYSDDPLTPGSISSTDPNEDINLSLTASSWLNRVELVWGIDPLPEGTGPITVYSGDSVAWPGVAGDVSRTSSDIDWAGDGDIQNADPVYGNFTNNLGITGCIGADASANTIIGANDWADLKYDFRTLNPDAFETGFGERQYFPEELNTTMIRDIRAKGINTTAYLIENLDDNKIGDLSCMDAFAQLIEGNFEIDDEYDVTISDFGANENDSVLDDIELIRIFSDHHPDGIVISAVESDVNTGIFGLQFETTALNGTAGKVYVEDNDTVTVEFTDACSVGPIVMGQNISFTFRIGGNSSDIDVKIKSLPDKVRTEFLDKLNDDPASGMVHYVKSNVSDSSLIELVMNDSLDTALKELLVMRTYLDGPGGGDPADDLVKEYWESERALKFLDNNIASIKEALNIPYNGPHAFEITSLDEDCLNATNATDPCVIGVTAETLTSVTDTFQINATKKRITVDLIGQGDVELEMPPILDVGGIFSVHSNYHGGEYDFNFGNGSDPNSLVIHDTSYYPRELAIFYGPYRAAVQSIDLYSSNGSQLSSVAPGTEAIIQATLENFGGWYHNQTSIIEVRNSNNVTVFLKTPHGVMPPDGWLLMNESWTEKESGDYTIRTFVVSDLDNPEILSDVEGKGIKVGGAGSEARITVDRTSYIVGDTVVVTIADGIANRAAQIAEVLSDLRVFSDSDRVGDTFSAAETDVNTGIFVFAFATSTSTEPGKILARSGDSVTIEYNDSEGRTVSSVITIE